MTAEHSPSDDDRFNEIIQGFEGALLRERGDPEVDDIFAEIAEKLEVLNNQADHISDTVLADIASELNQVFNTVHMLGAPIAVTGRLRPTNTSLRADGELNPNASTSPAELGVQRYEQAGIYVASDQLYFKGITLHSTRHTDGTGSTAVHYSARLHFAPDELSTNHSYAYPDDIDTFAPIFASQKKVEQVLRSEFPDVVEYIDAHLPHRCDDDMRIIDALQTFRLSIDWSAHPELQLTGREEIRRYIERYITERLRFDESLYTFELAHDYHSLDINSQIIRVELPEPISAYAGINRVQLVEFDGPEGSIFEAWLVLLAPGADRRTGSYVLHVPATSVLYLAPIRNTLLSANEPDAILPATSTDVINPLPDFAPEKPSFETAIIGREYELSRIENWYQTLIANVREFTGIEYPTKAKVEAAGRLLGAVLTNALVDYPGDPDAMIASYGDGVVGVSPEPVAEESGYDRETGLTMMVYRGLNPEASDMTNPRRGTFSQYFYTRMVSEVADQPPFRLASYFVFNDAAVDDTRISLVTNPELANLYMHRPEQQFHIELNTAKTQLTIPELERLRDCRQAIEALEDNYPELAHVSHNLRQLQYEVAIATSDKYTAVTDVALLRDIGVAVAGNSNACADTMTALSVVLRGASVNIAGPIYRLSGEIEDTYAITGMIEGSVSVVNNTDTEEPLLVVATSQTERWYVPLSSVELCAF